MWQDYIQSGKKEGEDCLTTERRGLYDYLRESKEDMLSGALKCENVIEGETKDGIH